MPTPRPETSVTSAAVLKPGSKIRLSTSLSGQALGVFGFQQAALHGLLANLREVDAAAIVANFDDDLRALVIRVEINRAARGFAGGDAVFGAFDAVIDGVAHDVHQRLGERVENALVEIGVLAGEVESDVFAALLGDVANEARETAEQLLDGHHANLEHAFVQLIENARLKRESVGELGAQRIVLMAFVELGQRAVEHRLADDEFADEIHDGVDARGIDAERAFDNGGGGRALCGRLSSRRRARCDLLSAL